MKSIYIVLVTLALHLFYTNSELLIANKELLLNKAPGILDKVFLTLFALSYSLMTAFAILKIHNLISILIFGLLDGFAVYLRVNFEQENFVLITSLFYGFYTFYIILCCYWIKKSENKQEVKEKPKEETKEKELEINEEEVKELPPLQAKYKTFQSLNCAINRLEPKTPERIQNCLQQTSEEIAQEWIQKNTKKYELNYVK